LTFAERALVSSGRTRMASAAQKRGMGACFFLVTESERLSLSLVLFFRGGRGNRSFGFFFVFITHVYDKDTRRRTFDWPYFLFSLSLSNLNERAAGGEGGVTHEGLTIHPAAPVHKILGTAMGGLMWFWVMYRFYHDGETLIYGHEPHFLHDDHHDDDEDGHNNNKKHW